jgi:hypothetical protein
MKTRRNQRTILLFVILELLALSLAGWMYPDNAELFFKAAARYTARVSLICFAWLFLTWSGREKRFFKPFLLAAVHIFHLLFVIAYVEQYGAWPPFVRLAGGVLAYGMLVVLPVLGAIRGGRLFDSRAGRGITALYLGYLWLVFFLSYLPRMQGKVSVDAGWLPLHWFFMVCIVLLVPLRLFFLRRRPLP